MTALAFAAGYVTCAISVALLIGAVVRESDRRAIVTTVLDPETGAAWTETRRLDVRA